MQNIYEVITSHLTGYVLIQPRISFFNVCFSAYMVVEAVVKANSHAAHVTTAANPRDPVTAWVVLANISGFLIYLSV